MPKVASDYSKTIIYKLCCKDPTITEIYIGSTTNFSQRKRQHKNNCKCETNKDYNTHKAQFIRANGDWENWCMIQIEEYPCENKREAEMRERYWVEQLQSKLNSNIPFRNKEEIVEYKKQYEEANKAKISEQRKQYYEANKEQISEYHKQYREANKEQISEQRKQYYEANKEQRKQYYEANKEQISEYKKQYRIKKKQQELTTEII